MKFFERRKLVDLTNVGLVERDPVDKAGPGWLSRIGLVEQDRVG
jgi:hypothetical protein